MAIGTNEHRPPRRGWARLFPRPTWRGGVLLLTLLTLGFLLSVSTALALSRRETGVASPLIHWSVNADVPWPGPVGESRGVKRPRLREWRT